MTSVSFLEASEEIKMDDLPLQAVRRKKNSSLHIGFEALKEGSLDALISTGNTGAITALATMKLDLMAGIDRPCLLATVPTMEGETSIVDVGASSHLDPLHLLQFTALGVTFLKKFKKHPRPKVALLNIGRESMKGTAQHRQLFETLKQDAGDFLFLGNIEGKELFRGEADLVITDGFTGNIFLKAAEGMAEFLLDAVSPHLDVSILTTLKKRFTQEASPGAFLIGIKQGLIIKCHGLSTAATMTGAILKAYHHLKA
jgi:glycerol-3-phosphate acyltransferase PlsX